MQLLRTSAFLALLICALAAAAARADIATDLQIADRYWVAQGYQNPCSGHVEVVFDATLRDRDAVGEAGGTGPCTIAIMPGMEPVPECYTVVHEVGHLAYGHWYDGLAHAGPMDPENMHPTECQSVVPPRMGLIAAIRAGLPTPRASWRVNCTPTSVEMTCWARSPHARYVRRYAASVDESLIWSFESPVLRKV